MSSEIFRPSKKYISNDIGYLLVEHFFIFLVATVMVFFVPWTLMNSMVTPLPKDAPISDGNLAHLILSSPGPFVAVSILIGIIITLFFIFKKVRKKEIMYVDFDDAARELKIGLKKYFDKETQNKKITYNDLKFSHEVKKASGERGYKFKIEFFDNDKQISTLNSSRGIWQLYKDQKQLGEMINRLKRITGS